MDKIRKMKDAVGNRVGIASKAKGDTYAEVMKKSVEERRAPPNRFFTSPKLDQSTFEAYERYVMAQFRFTDATEAESERREAIESLIPGTVGYYHLYFLDLHRF